MLQAFTARQSAPSSKMMGMNVHGNNIANVNTYGYKAEKPAFGVLMNSMVNGVDGVQLPKGSGAAVMSTATDFREAEITQTGRDQDYAILGPGFFALYDPSTQEISFTRDGSFTISSFQEAGEDGTMETVVVSGRRGGTAGLKYHRLPHRGHRSHRGAAGGDLSDSVSGWSAAFRQREIPERRQKWRSVDRDI